GGSDPISFKTAGDYVYFLARQSGDAVLWRSDGTEAGTIMLFDTGYADSTLASWSAIALGDSLAFKLAGKLWVTGPEPGSQRLVMNAGDSSGLSLLIAAGDKFYFAAEPVSPPYIPTLYVSDGV